MQRQPHDLASSLWGGAVSEYQPRNPRHRLQYQWSRQSAAAAMVIAQVEPLLRIKGDQAAIALELFEHQEFGRVEDPWPWMGSGYDGLTQCETSPRRSGT